MASKIIYNIDSLDFDNIKEYYKLNNLDLYIKPIMISILKKTDVFGKTLIVKSY